MGKGPNEIINSEFPFDEKRAPIKLDHRFLIQKLKTKEHPGSAEKL